MRTTYSNILTKPVSLISVITLTCTLPTSLKAQGKLMIFIWYHTAVACPSAQELLEKVASIAP